MRTMRLRVAPLTAAALAASLLLVPSADAQQQDPYYATLHFGTGLVETPVAWISPNSTDSWFAITGVEIPGGQPNPSEMRFSTRWNTNVALDTHWMGRFSVGVAAYSQNPEWGFFGQALLLKDNQVGFLPAVAVGVRNLGPYSHEERYLIGEDIRLEGGGYKHIVSPEFEGFNTSPTLYAVATKGFLLSSITSRLPATTMSVNLGVGNGIFSDDGGRGDWYNRRGTIARGLFLGTRVVTHPSLNTTLTFMGENDGWDWNAGAVFDWRGIYAGFYGRELEEGGSAADAGNGVYNYRKISANVGYTGNILDIARGVILRTRITELTREQQRLRYEIAARERRIRGLEVALVKAQAGELATMEARRRALEAEVNEEREAIRRAEERLRQIQQGQLVPGQPPAQPTPTPPPSGQPTPTPVPPANPPAGSTTTSNPPAR